MADSDAGSSGLLVPDLEARARDVLPAAVYDYYAGGSDTETTLREAPLAWLHWRVRPRVLTGGVEPELSTSLLGSPVKAPIGVAPWAMQRMAHPDGELATAAGCGTTGTLMTVSTSATVPLAEVAAVSPEAPKWFQLYRVHNRAQTDHLVRRAADVGYRALVVTADLPVLGRRLRDLANDFRLPDGLVMANYPERVGVLGQEIDATGDTPPWSYADIEHFVGLTDLPVVVKGVLRGDDAVRSLEAGAAAVWVSTHGGRQLDRAVSSATALVDVVSAVGGRAEIYVDGGIRSGTDVLVALALGARGVFCGRPIIWGLATGGADGVTAVLSNLSAELAHVMTLCGIGSVERVPRDLLTS